MDFSGFCKLTKPQYFGYNNQSWYLKGLFKAAGIRRDYSDDYLKAVFNGTKPFSSNMKRYFPHPVRIDSIAAFFEKHLQSEYVKLLADAFGIPADEEKNLSYLSYALAAQVAAFISNREETESENIVPDKYCSHIAMSGKVICGECGAPFQRTHWILKGEKVIVWRCRSRLQKGKKSGCHSRTIREADLQKAVVKAVQDLILDEDRIYNDICSDVQELTTGVSEIELDDINTKLAELQQQVLSWVKTGKDTSELAEEIQQLRDRKNKIETEKSERKRDEDRVAALRESVEKAMDKVLTYDEQLVRNFIEEIRVFPDKLTITVKGGAKEDIII